MKGTILRKVAVFALILACLCSSALAEEQASLWFEMRSGGNDYTVSVHISGETKPEMLQFCLRYDEEKLHLLSLSAGEIFRGTTPPTISTNEAGRVYFVWDALKPLSDGIIMVLDFSVKDGVIGSASIWFDTDFDTIAADGDYNEISLNTQRLEIPIGTEEDITQEPVITPKPTATPTNEVAATENSNVQGTDMIDRHEVVLSIGETRTIESREDQEWISRDESVASVDAGTIVGISEGTTEITAETEDGIIETYSVRITTNPKSVKVLDSQAGEKSNNYLVIITIVGIIQLLALITIVIRIRTRKSKTK